MTIQEACNVLGLSPKAGLPEIKKKYRSLMMRFHPDAGAGSRRQQECAYTVQEINTAYSILKEAASADAITEIQPGKSKPHTKKQIAWTAPLNENAYTERNVLQYAEDHEGAVLGSFCIASGKYMWTTEEDFPLFLLSLYQCGKELLDEADALLCREEPSAGRQRFQAELTYLLAQQFISQTELLKELAKEETTDAEGKKIFYVPAMLEAANGAVSPKPGEPLYPSAIRRHRLFLKNSAGQEAGYLSFRDDRLYYVVLPLFEQRRVQIRIRTAEKQPEKKKRAAPGYQNLHLWIRLSDKNSAGLPENLNLQIEGLLKRYNGSK